MLELGIAYPCTQFDNSSFNHSRDMVGARQNLNGFRDLTTPLLGKFVIRRLALATINPLSKFEVSNSTHYDDTKCDTKCRKWGGLG